MTNNTVNAQISKEYIELSYKDNGANTKTKVVSLDQLKSILLEQMSLDTPLLPSQWGVIQYSRNANNEQFVITMKEHKRTLTFFDGDTSDPDDVEDNSREYNVVIPNTVWIINTRLESNGSRSLLHTLAYAIKNPVFKLENTEIYRLPLSNCDDGYVCWSGQHPELPTSYSVSNVVDRFLDSTFNYDLSGGKVTSFRDDEHDVLIENIFDFWAYMGRELSKNPDYRFEYDKLVKVDSYLNNRIESMKADYL